MTDMNAGEAVWVVMGVYLLANIAALLTFYVDKRASVRKLRRVPERTLLTIAFFGPFGTLVAMRSFRHKTRKNRFLLVYLFAVLHIAVAVYLLLLQIGIALPSLF